MIKPILWLIALSAVSFNIHAKNNFDNLIKTLEHVSHHWKVMGSGSPMRELNLKENFSKFLAYPNGSCAQEAYYFAREAKAKKFNAMRLGLWSSSGTNDVMVEVQDQSSTYLFVPSAGVFYRFSLWELLQTPMLANQYVGTPKLGTEIFISPDFFSSIIKIDRFLNDNNIEKNLLTLSREVDSFGLMTGYGGKAGFDNNKNNYIAGLANAAKQGFTVKLDSPIDIYRVNINWYSFADRANNVNIEIKHKTGVLELNSDSHKEYFYQSGKELNVYTGNLEGVEELTFRFSDFRGQKRTLISDIGVY